MRVSRTLGFVVAAIVAVATATTAAHATTAPSKRVVAIVRITDTGLKLWKYIGSASSPTLDLETMPGPIPRGDYLSITIVNTSKKIENFEILGRRTAPIKPGHKAHLFIALLTRGTFSYGSTVEKATSFHGALRVF